MMDACYRKIDKKKDSNKTDIFGPIMKKITKVLLYFLTIIPNIPFI